MANEKQSPLVSSEWLAEHLDDRELIILDGSFFLPNQHRDARAEFLTEHIPGAQFFDIDEVADHSTALPHMLPNPDQFARAVGSMGIGNDTLVVAYDNNFFMASARVWWMFRVFGHDRVAVLDGGMARWKQQGLPVNPETIRPQGQAFQSNFRPELVRNLSQVRVLLEQPGKQILDARSSGRFRGTEPEPRAGIRGGHMPGSLNLPHRTLVDEASFRLRPAMELAEIYRQTGIDIAGPTITTCGTGVTAAILALGLHLLGNEAVAVYDGSWTEWGGREDVPVETG